MLIANFKIFIFKLKNVYFASGPFDIEGCDVVNFIDHGERMDVKGFDRKETHTAVVNLAEDIDTLWHNVKKQFRKDISRAKREGVEIIISRDYQEFYQVYKSFKKKKGFGPILWTDVVKPETMEKYGTLFIARYNGELLGGNVYLEDESHLRLWVSASRRFAVDKDKMQLMSRANRLLQWEAIKYAKEKKMKEFDFGGLLPSQVISRARNKERMNHFKLSFGAEPVTRYSYQKVYLKSYKAAQNFYYLVKKFRRE